jgi:hypothetical protein
MSGSDGIYDAWHDWLRDNGSDVLHAMQAGVAEGMLNAMPIVADLLLAFAQGVGAEMPTPNAVLEAVHDGVASAMPRPHDVLTAIEHGAAR